MDNSDVLEFFDQTFCSYDEWIPKVVPMYHELQREIIRVTGCVFPDSSAELNLLELGLGSGVTASRQLAKYPNSSLTAIALSPNMVKIANEKLAEHLTRLRTHVGDFTDFDFGEDRYDMVYSSLSIHHYENEAMKDIFIRIFKALKPGEMFINADIVKFDTDSYSQKAG